MLKDGASIPTVATIFLLENCPLADCQVSSGPNYVRHSYFHSDSVYLGSSMERKDILKGILTETWRKT